MCTITSQKLKAATDYDRTKVNAYLFDRASLLEVQPTSLQTKSDLTSVAWPKVKTCSIPTVNINRTEQNFSLVSEFAKARWWRRVCWKRGATARDHSVSGGQTIQNIVDLSLYGRMGAVDCPDLVVDVCAIHLMRDQICAKKGQHFYTH